MLMIFSAIKDVSLKKLIIISAVAFTVISGLTVIFSPLLQRFYPLLPDKGAWWYFWQTAEPTIAGKISYWLGYALHQILCWLILFKARNIGMAEPGKAHKWNTLLLVVNLAFVSLHLLQTQLFYDGLATDVPVWSSQGSVILMLILVLFLKMPERGIIFGIGRKTPEKMLQFTKKTHGFYISWALVYTFWFHPMEGNWGLLSGFIYMFLLFIQMSLFNTDAHVNSAWQVLLEVFVAVHAFLITIYKEWYYNETVGMWPMFLYGFLFLFVFTQVYSLNWPAWLRIVLQLTFIAAVVITYTTVRDINKLYEILFIPGALYGGALLWKGIGLLWEKTEKEMPPS